MQGSMREYERWLGEDRLDGALRAELEAIAGDAAAIEDRFYQELEFGTAGLRGVIGAGTNRMNRNVVGRATRGLADYIHSFPGGAARGVAIAYDSRRMSDGFALEAALVLAANGVRAYLFDSIHSVPQLSFAVRQLGCIAGVVITASHNPPAYNGYKVYWEDGGQVGPEEAQRILGHIREAGYFSNVPMDRGEAERLGLLKSIGSDIDEAYYAAIATLRLHPEIDRARANELKLVYTPLHGSGRVPVMAMLERMGVDAHIVELQAAADPAFPTVTAPNPEDPGVFAMAIELADGIGSDVILATDPDSDRLGIAVRAPDGAFRVLSGNQIGSLLIHYILSSLYGKGALPKDGLVVKSIVSTSMADAVCQRFGVDIEEVPTGFRFIAERIAACERDGAKRFLFGFEESYGFLAGTFTRDKDAISTAMLIAEACAFYREQERTLLNVLLDMDQIYGCFREAVKSYTLEGKEGIARIMAAMDTLRSAGLKGFDGMGIVSAEDFLSGTRMDIGNERTSETAIRDLNMLRYHASDGAWICVRPSGTEPKLKVYIGVKAVDAITAQTRLSELMTEVESRISALLQ